MLVKILLYGWTALSVPVALLLIGQTWWHETHALRPCLGVAMAISQPSTKKSLPPELLEAEQDTQLLLLGQPPLHAIPVGLLSDGGSSVYESPRYTITHWHRFMTINGVHGYKQGFSVSFHPVGDKGGRVDDDFSHSWFEPHLPQGIKAIEPARQ